MPSFSTFSGVYPDSFMVLDNTKESNYFSFALPTLTYNNGYKFYEANRHRKYPYYVAIEDNNNTTLPSEFNPDNIVMKQMFGVHFFNKPFNIDFKKGFVGCKDIPLFNYCSVDPADRRRLVYSDKNSVKVTLPSVIMFNILNGVNVPVVYVDGKRIYFYSDEKSMTYDSSSDDYKANPYTYTNIKFERRAFTPVPYKKVFDIPNEDATNGSFYYSRLGENSFIQVTAQQFPNYDGYEHIDYTILTPEQFNKDTFYTIVNNSYVRQNQFNQSIADDYKYYRKMQLYILDTKYGKYSLTPTQSNPGNNNKEIPIFRNLDEILWWDGIVEHGISTSVNYSNVDGEIVDNLLPNDEKYKVYDKGEYQYVISENNETVIEAEDGYTSVNKTINNGISISSKDDLISFGSIDDGIGVSFRLGEEDNKAKDVYFFYYIDEEQGFGNCDKYDYLTLSKFNTGEGNVPPYTSNPAQDRTCITRKESNYPLDWSIVDTYNGGWKINSEKMPELFTRNSTELKKYPGYIANFTTSFDTFRVSAKSSNNIKMMLYGDDTTQGFYETGADDKLNNYRFFAIMDYNNTRAITPVYDNRTILANTVSYICSSQAELDTFQTVFDFSSIRGINNKVDDKYVYLWPQKPIRGKHNEDGAVYDILSSPYLTNYSFEFSAGSLATKTYTEPDTNGNPVQVPMTQAEFPNYGLNELRTFTANATYTIDLKLANNIPYDTLGYGIEYIKFKDFKYTGDYTYTELYNLPSWQQALSPLSTVQLGQQKYVSWYGDGYDFINNIYIYHEYSDVCGKRLKPAYNFQNGLQWFPTFGYPKSIHVAKADVENPTSADDYEEISLYCREQYNPGVPYPLTEESLTAYNVNTSELTRIKTTLKDKKIFYNRTEIEVFTCLARVIKINPTIVFKNETYPNGISMSAFRGNYFSIKDVTGLKKITTEYSHLPILQLNPDDPDDQEVIDNTFFSNSNSNNNANNYETNTNSHNNGTNSGTNTNANNENTDIQER